MFLNTSKRGPQGTVPMEEFEALTRSFLIASMEAAGRLEKRRDLLDADDPADDLGTRKAVYAFTNTADFQYHSLTPRERRLEGFEDAREELADSMEDLDWLDPRTGKWEHSIENAEVGDTILTPFVAFCKDKKQIAPTKHHWLPGRGAHILSKYRWSVVVRKDSSMKRLYMHPTYTFSEMTTEVKREQVLTDESTGETHDAFADFAHVVTDKDNTVPDEPKCFENGLQLNCRSMPGFEATKKSSYMSLDEQAIHEDGIPFQIRAKVASKEDLDVLLKIVEASAKRLKSGLERAIDNWVDVVPSTPAFGSITTHGNPATSIQNDATVSAQEKPAPSVQDKPSQPEPPRFGAHLSAMLDVASQHNTPSEYAQAGTANPSERVYSLGSLDGRLANAKHHCHQSKPPSISG
jgi:hypothetical protein